MQAMKVALVSAPYLLTPRLVRQQDDMDAFMDTFDTAVTVTEETFDRWAVRNDVRVCQFDTQDYMLMSFMGMSTHMKEPFNRGDLLDAAYFLGCIFYGSEEGYLEWYMDLHATL